MDAAIHFFADASSPFFCFFATRRRAGL